MTPRIAAFAVASLLVAAACSGDDDSSDGGDASSTPTSADDQAADDPSTAGAVSLVDVCPDPLVIQTDWFPEAEYGASYHLIGPDPVIDPAAKTVRGPLVTTDGADTGIEVEVRSGGPALAGESVISVMQQDRDVLFGYISTDEAVRQYDLIPTTAVVAPLEINPQMVMWDPASQPNVSTIADLQADDVTIRYFPNVAFMDYLVSSGQVAESQLDGSYDGAPAVFVAEDGAIAQQGFATSEPFTYEFLVPEWGKPVSFELIHDTGWEIYSQPFAVLTERLDEVRPCLEQVVPIVQEAVVDYLADPSETNALIVEAVAVYDDFWIYDLPLAEFSIEQQRELGIVGNGPNDTVGDFDLDRIESFLPIARDVFGEDVPADLTADDIATNEFIDPSVGL